MNRTIILVFLIFVNCFKLCLNKVVFPPENEEIDNPMPKLKPKKPFRIDSSDVPCSNVADDFCEEVSEQLDEAVALHVKSVLKERSDQYTGLLNKVITRDNFPRPSNRCATYARMRFPKIARNVDSDWHFVINQPEYLQPVEVEICQKKFSQCPFSEIIPAKNVSMCTQKFRKIALWSLNDGGNITKYEYEFQSHCKCE